MDAKQRRALKAQGQLLDDRAQIGKQGLTEAAIANVDVMLTKELLLKVRLPAGSPSERKELAQRLADEVGAQFVASTGRMALFYREAKDPESDPQGT